MLSALAWLAAGSLLLVPAALALAGVATIPVWFFLAYLFAGAAAALLAADRGRVLARVAAAVAAAGWLAGILAVVLWSSSGGVVAAVLLGIGGAVLAVAAAVGRDVPRLRRAALGMVGAATALLAVASSVVLPAGGFLIVLVVVGAAFVTAGIALVRTDAAAGSERSRG